MAKYKARVKVESDLWPQIRRYWHPVAMSEELPENEVLAVRLLDKRLAVCRLAGEVRAFYDLCIHRGTPLSLGWIEGDNLVCAYHGWSYAKDGKCVRIPSVPPDHPIPKKACLTPYLAQEKYGFIWVCLSDEPIAPIPDFPEYTDPNFRILLIQGLSWKGSAARVIENFVDQAHLVWVHPGLLGERDQALAPEIQFEQQGDKLMFWFDNPPDYLDPNPHLRFYTQTLPFTLHHRKGTPGGKMEVFFVVTSPQSAAECTRFMIVARNFDLDARDIVNGPLCIREKEVFKGELNDLAERRVKFLETIFDQDHEIVENQRPEELPMDWGEELHLKGPDAPAIAYRKMMQTLGVEV